jgi:ribose transport system substrate-binding protein
MEGKGMRGIIGAALLAMAALCIVEPAHSEGDRAKAAAERLQPYRGLPKFSAAGPAFDARTCMKGKSILGIPVSSANPFTKNIYIAMTNAAKNVGFTFREWENQGQPSQWVQGMDYATNNKFDLIDLLGGTDPKVLAPQVQKATSAGIKVIASHYSGFEQPLPGYISGAVPIDYLKAGQLLADWAIWKTDAKVNALVIVSTEVYSTESMINGIKADFDQNCPGCKYKIVNAPVPEWSTKIQPTVQSALQADPSINYIIPIYDSMSQFVVPAITITGKKDSVKIATFNGTPFVLGFVQRGDVEMDIGENLDWIGHAIMDAEMRILCGLEPVKDPKIPFYIFDSSNAANAGKPPQLSVGYGDAYLAGYVRQWKLEK